MRMEEQDENGRKMTRKEGKFENWFLKSQIVQIANNTNTIKWTSVHESCCLIIK